ncbi:hypothetical protein [Streptomyces sp. AC495_CC817]|uniref:hypothetical protein n=1 Tax=Streptomyces sp. AC495_CC817 TaxID=2823900 RepID=UPI001C2585B2|nr:hypothetical protein [Streptomyces sp. AC495_CC817]
MNDESITIEVPVKRATQAHIESIQAKLAQRNETIDRLKAEIEELRTTGINQAIRSQEFERGWKACAHHLTEATEEAARALRKVRKDAMDIYYGYKDVE